MANLGYPLPEKIGSPSYNDGIPELKGEVIPDDNYYTLLIDFYNNPSKYEINPFTGEPTGYGGFNPGEAPEYELVLWIGEVKTAELIINGAIKLAPKIMAAVSTFSKGSKVATETVCFVSGTMILTSNGLKAIESIATQDSVWTYNVETKTKELNTVPNIFKRSSFEFVCIWYGVDSVNCTPEHPFFENNTWKVAKNIKVGDSLFAYSGYKVALDSIRTFRTDTATAVYNLEADGLLVHNNI